MKKQEQPRIRISETVMLCVTICMIFATLPMFAVSEIKTTGNLDFARYGNNTVHPSYCVYHYQLSALALVVRGVEYGFDHPNYTGLGNGYECYFQGEVITQLLG